MPLNQNQNQDETSSVPTPPPTLTELNEQRLKKQIEEGQKMAEQQSTSEQEKIAEIRPQIDQPPEKEGATSPLPAQEEIDTTPTEHPLVAMQREKACRALEEEETTAKKLEMAREAVKGTEEEVAKATKKTAVKAELAVERTDIGKPQAVEAARSAQTTAEEIAKTTRDLTQGTRVARATEKEAAGAQKKAQSEINKYNQLKKLDPYSQKNTLEAGRQGLK